MSMPRASLLFPALTLALLLAATDGSAQSPSRDVKLAGMGIRKCTEWQQWKDARNTESRAMVLEWAQGFIAGHNIYARSGSTTTSPVVASVAVLIPLLDAYCQKNPEQRIFSGVVEITQSLGGAKVNITPKATPPRAPQPEQKGRLDS
ncbi:MAG: hypothetical protein IPL72_05455 [Sulfuritalea sp.]|nr:hypothetical protein [Sulfuritalea sp.]